MKIENIRKYDMIMILKLLCRNIFFSVLQFKIYYTYVIHKIV